MKTRLLLLASALLLISTFSIAQKLSDKDVIGTWKLVIGIDEAMDEAKQELREEGGSAFEKLVLSSITGLVTNIVEEIDLQIQFRKDREAVVYVTAFEEEETEYTTWKIVDNRLYIEDTDSFKSDTQDYWILRNGVLISVNEEEGPNDHVYMVRE